MHAIRTGTPVAAMLLVLALPLPILAREAITVNQETVYYGVTGLTTDEIARSIRENRPESMDDFIGEATYYFTWTYNYRPGRDGSGFAGCRVFGAAVVIDVTVNLPRHDDIGEAPKDVREFWENFIAALERHELNHAGDFIETGSLIPAAIDGVTAANCVAVQAVANKKGMQYVDLAQQQADEYDAETNHGIEEGALFPGF